MVSVENGTCAISLSKTLPIRSADDILLLRAAVRSAALEVRLGLLDLTKLVTAAVEIARNTLIYGLGGEVAIDTIHAVPPGVRLTFSDDGPGIPDIDRAMKEGFTTGNAMGLGLGGTSRLVDEFHIVSAPHEGTTVTIAKWQH